MFHRGKQLENGYKLFDYSVNVNDVVLLTVKVKLDKAATCKSNSSINNQNDQSLNIPEEEILETESRFYKVGDAIDCIDQACGAWYEAIIEKIFKVAADVQYKVKWQFGETEEPFVVRENFIRPRAYRILKFKDLKSGQRVMINYNIEDPEETGLWYDLTIKKIHDNRSGKYLTGTIHIGK